eukprot:4015564-Amphidinium_carterae.2
MGCVISLSSIKRKAPPSIGLKAGFGGTATLLTAACNGCARKTRHTRETTAKERRYFLFLPLRLLTLFGKSRTDVLSAGFSSYLRIDTCKEILRSSNSLVAPLEKYPFHNMTSIWNEASLFAVR